MNFPQHSGPDARPASTAPTAASSEVRRQEPGIFVGFEETAERLAANTGGFDWNLAELSRGRGRLRELRGADAAKRSAQ